MSLRVHLRFKKSLLRRAQQLCFGLGYACMGLCAVMMAQAWFFQAYESWAFEQRSQGEAVSVKEFVAQTVSLSEPDDSHFIARLALDRAKARTLGFHPPEGRSVVGRIEIPRVRLKTMILEGVSQRTLALAVGHIPGTALPGKTGNVGLAGHRDTFFRSLAGIHLNDAIVLTTLEGTYQYRVKSCQVVGPRDTGVLADSNTPALTLVTCYPFHYVGPAPKRFIVHAVLETL
jgi:LPXTG-site transpeptidase (sortase) family protein